MARLISLGYELGDLDKENLNTNGSPAAPQTSTVISGTYTQQISSLSSGTAKGVRTTFASSAANGPYYVRFKFRVATLPSAENRVFAISSFQSFAAANHRVYVTIDNTGVLRLYDEDGQVGSSSSALSTNTTYRIEVQADKSPSAGSHVVRATIDGTEFAGSATRDISTGFQLILLGGNLNSESQTTGNWFFDDIAVNSSSGSFQTGYPGAGSTVHLHPNAAGDNAGFARGGSAVAATPWESVDEVTPNDGTDYTNEKVLNKTDDHNLESPLTAIDQLDAINLVSVGVRFAGGSSSNNASFVPRIKATASGTVEEGSAITPNTTSWRTNVSSVPEVYSLICYDLPGSSTKPWNRKHLHTTQIGYRISTGNTNDAIISTVWLLVDYTDVAHSTEAFNPSNSADVSPRYVGMELNPEANATPTLDASGDYFGGMIVPPASKDVTSLEFCNWSHGGTFQTQTVELRNDNGGVPGATVHTSGTVTPSGNFTFNSASVSSFSVTAGTPYWVVIYSASNSGTNSIEMRTLSDPDGLIIPSRFASSFSSNSGSTWSVDNDNAGAVGLGFSDGSFQGFGYTDYDVTTINDAGERFGEYFQPDTGFTSDQIGFKVKKSDAGTPSAALEYYIYNVTDATTEQTGTLVAAATVTTSFVWYYATLSPSINFDPNKIYRVGMSTTAGSGTRYQFHRVKTTNTGNSNAMTYGGASKKLTDYSSEDATRDIPHRMRYVSAYTPAGGGGAAPPNWPVFSGRGFWGPRFN